VVVEVLARVQRQQPEQALRVVGEGAVGEVEREFHAGVQALEVVPLVQAVGVVGQRPPGPAVDVPDDEPERERQVPAPVRDAGGGAGIGADGTVRRRPGQHPARLGGGEHVDHEMGGAVQAGQPAAAGDETAAAGRIGQQRAHLLLVGGVVQHHQGPASGDPVPVRGGAPR
jgi:hypothetical protein